MSGEVLVGLDLGTSSLKGVALGADGAVEATALAAYPTLRPEPGRAEQDPNGWWLSLRHVVETLREAVPANRWRGIGLSGMIPTMVVAGADGEPLGPAITWEDGRAAEDGARFREEAGAQTLYERTGQWVDGRYLLPMLRWLQRTDPDGAAPIAALHGAKDEIFRRLTGRAVTDPSTATGFGCYVLATGEWDLSLAGDAAPLLPEVRPSSWSAPLQAEAAALLELPSGLPVFLGGADSVSGAYGLHAGVPGDLSSLWGTSTVIIGVSGAAVPDPDHRYLITPLVWGGAWGLEMDLISTGSAFAWAAVLLGFGSPVSLMEAAASAEPGARGLQFLPYVGFGEQGALWDEQLRGTIYGLTLQHTHGDVARALAEGVALEFRRCLGVLRAADAGAGDGAGPVHASGGAMSSTFFRSLLADAVGLPLEVSPLGSYISAYGAARLAATASGVPEPEPAVDVQGDRPATTGPVPGSAAAWQALAERHDALLATIRS